MGRDTVLDTWTRLTWTAGAGQRTRSSLPHLGLGLGAEREVLRRRLGPGLGAGRVGLERPGLGADQEVLCHRLGLGLGAEHAE